MAWYDEAVFYHIYPLGLTRAPDKNDYKGGANRFENLYPWIDHIKELGFNALYIGPLFESVGHGYETTDYRKADSRLGTNDDLKAFVAYCHEKEIKVVLDGVFNHTGRDFFAFKDLQANRESSRYRDWYCGVNFYGNNEYNDGFSYESWRGFNLLVKLNLKNPEVVSYLLDSVEMWIREFDIDGIRLDSADVLDFDFMRSLRNRTDSLKHEFWLMGEVIHGEYHRWANAGMLHSVTNYHLHKALYSAHNDHNYFEIAHTIKRQMDMGLMGISLYNFVDNHDVERIYTRLNDKKNFMPVHVLLYTLPGIPSVYYGSEFAIEGRKERYSDASLRPWLDLEKMRAERADYAGLIQTLGTIHRNCPDLWYGQYREMQLTTSKYAFARGDAIITVNNTDQPERFDLKADGKYAGLIGRRGAKSENGILRIEIPANGAEIWIPEEKLKDNKPLAGFFARKKEDNKNENVTDSEETGMEKEKKKTSAKAKTQVKETEKKAAAKAEEVVAKAKKATAKAGEAVEKAKKATAKVEEAAAAKAKKVSAKAEKTAAKAKKAGAKAEKASTNEVKEKTMNEAAAEAVSEAAAGAVTETAPEAVTEAAPEAPVEAAPEAAAEAAPEPARAEEPQAAIAMESYPELPEEILPQPRRSVAFIGSECYPFVKTGGLGDVMYSLPKALIKQNCDVKVILPRYKCIPWEYQEKMVYRGDFMMDLCIDGRSFYVGIMEYVWDGVVYDFIDNEEFFSSGNPYTNLIDDIPKFCFFAKASLAILNYMNWIPDVIHCHDWQAALVPVYLRTLFANTPVGNAAVMLTIHNLRFQGLFNIPTLRYWTGLPDYVFNKDALKQGYEDANMMKGGITYSNMVTTVSNTYAGEIQSPFFGEGLDSHLRYHAGKLRGIVNGIDYSIWNTKTDPRLAVNFDINDAILKKKECKRALQEQLGLRQDDHMFVIGLISRLTDQKGLDLVNAVLPSLLDGHTQIVILGTGDYYYENAFRYYENINKGIVCSNIMYDENRAHAIYAGADALLVPSLFEPCGLTQLIAMHYGTIPIVRETGGLKDTVEPYNEFYNSGNGFTFDRYESGLLYDAINRAKTLYFTNRWCWDEMVCRDMAKDVSWDSSAKQYRQLYLELKP